MHLANKLEFEQWKMFAGDETYIYDVVDGPAEIKVDAYSDCELICWLDCKKADGTPIAVPVAHGRVIRVHTKVTGLTSIRLTTASKKATVAVCVLHRLINTNDPLDLTPVEIVPPPANELRLMEFISKEVARRMGDVAQEVTIDEDDDIDDDIPEDEFAVMDDEQEAAVLDRRVARAVERAQRSRRVRADDTPRDGNRDDDAPRSRRQRDREPADDRLEPRAKRKPPKRELTREEVDYRQGEGYGDDDRE